MKKNNNKIKKVISKFSTRVAKLKEHVSKKDTFEEQFETDNLPEVKVDLDKVVLEISPQSVLKSTLVILMVLVGAYLLFSLSNILILFFIAFFIASALDPVIDLLQRNKIPRAIGILIVYVVIFLLVALLFALLLPLIAQQLFSLAETVNNFIVGISKSPTTNLPFGEYIKPYVEELYRAIDIKVVAVQLQDSLQLVSSQLLNLGGNLWSIILQISNGLLNLVLILILVFFMTVDEKALENFCISIFPDRYGAYITKRLEMVKIKIGEWIRGQLLVSLVATIISLIGLAIAGVQYSLLISIITGICMIIPVFGRVVAAVLVIPIVLNQSPALALFLIIYYFGISQIENNIIVPLLMNRAVGLSPIMIIFALMMGFQFLGVLGLVLAIPIATIVAIFARDVGRKIHYTA